MLERGGQSYYYHADALGSITSITDSSGNVVQSYTYDSFGRVSSSGSLTQPYTYTGRELDPETGLYYYRSRYYDPDTGRFIQEDPLWGVNLYAYVGNNPLNWIDPWGWCKGEGKPWWEKLYDWLVPSVEAYDSPWPGINELIEKIASNRIKEYAPDMPKNIRDEVARKLREEMTIDEYKKLKYNKTPEAEQAKIIEDIINRLKEKPENQELEEKVKPYKKPLITK